MKKFLHNLWLIVLLLPVLLILSIAQKPQAVAPQHNAYVPPAPVIIKEAKATKRGVALHWAASQPGSKPLGVYIIERAEDGRHFAFVARVEKSFLSFLDAEGRAGDTYRVIAEDTTGKNGRSEPSQPMIASASPGMTVMVSPDSTPNVLGATHGSTPDITADQLSRVMAAAFTNLRQALTNHDAATIRQSLGSLQNSHKSALEMWRNLGRDGKQVLKQTCTEHATAFQADLLALPEWARADGTLAEAGCRAIMDAV